MLRQFDFEGCLHLRFLTLFFLNEVTPTDEHPCWKCIPETVDNIRLAWFENPAHKWCRLVGIMNQKPPPLRYFSGYIPEYLNNIELTFDFTYDFLLPEEYKFGGLGINCDPSHFQVPENFLVIKLTVSDRTRMKINIIGHEINPFISCSKSVIKNIDIKINQKPASELIDFTTMRPKVAFFAKQDSEVAEYQRALLSMVRPISIILCIVFAFIDWLRSGS
ncbi:unnamed protein product [Ambrosiozyma monospora]|uniref:Unnamed protein product n=1 Tax=Ambrosiozyma monospora TaxID=43982 RepID=A0A9W6T6U0_AMBMO|nr:unnamed protein product [Ambrosiozyma monospora]